MTQPLKGRGAADNPTNRFELLCYERSETPSDTEGPGPATQFYRDATRSFISTNDSPDVGFDVSINPYRGCEHGCIYCYARPYHEYLGLSAGLDFETKILVKEDAPKLLRRELSDPRWKPRTLGISGVTDPYQPAERALRLTRRCLEVLAAFRNPVAIVTKSRLVTRDLDLLGPLAAQRAAAVCLSVTTLDDDLAAALEPRAPRPRGRLEAIREVAAAGVPVTALVAPIIPGLNDHEIPAILHEARAAGATHAGFVMLRLPHGLRDLFADWLDRHYPDRKAKVLGRVRLVRGGQLNTSQFGTRMTGEGPLADAVRQLFEVAYRKEGFPGRSPLSASAFRRPDETPSLPFGD